MSKGKVGVLGSGQVGQVLASGFLKHGYEVMVGTRDASKLDAWKTSTGGAGQVGSFEETATFGQVIVLATAGTAAEAVIRRVASLLAGKTVIDATNPIAQEAPEDGVLKYFTKQNESLMEALQAIAPEAHFVKAFSCVGNHFMVNPSLPGGAPTMFICGDDAGAKGEVSGILALFGWDVADMGTVKAARAIEPLAMLWCIPGLKSNSWTHAFKLLKL